MLSSLDGVRIKFKILLVSGSPALRPANAHRASSAHESGNPRIPAQIVAQLPDFPRSNGPFEELILGKRIAGTLGIAFRLDVYTL